MTTKQKILQEVIDAVSIQFVKARNETNDALNKEGRVTIDRVLEQSRSLGKMYGILDCLDLLRDLWISALNEEDK